MNKDCHEQLQGKSFSWVGAISQDIVYLMDIGADAFVFEAYGDNLYARSDGARRTNL